jgi:hypothetical protein
LAELISPTWAGIIIESGEATQVLQEFLESVTTAINNLAPLTGTGSPEGVVASSSPRWYVDGSDVYYKATGDGDTGWLLL